MGSFFNKGSGNTAQQINTGGTGGVAGLMSGNQSGLGKAFANDPVNNFLFGTKPAYVQPTAGPWAGTAPSLAAANSGYGLNSSGNPALTGGGSSPQLAATFAQRPASLPLTPASGAVTASMSPAQRPIMNSPGMAGSYLNASRGVMG